MNPMQQQRAQTRTQEPRRILMALYIRREMFVSTREESPGAIAQLDSRIDETKTQMVEALCDTAMPPGSQDPAAICSREEAGQWVEEQAGRISVDAFNEALKLDDEVRQDLLSQPLPDAWQYQPGAGRAAAPSVYTDQKDIYPGR